MTQVASHSVADRNPCPKCGRMPSHVAGCAIFKRDQFPAAKDHAFLVCWRCNVVVRIGPAMTWRPMSEMRDRIRQAT